MDEYQVAVRDLTEAEVEFTLERVGRFRSELAGRLARVALRNRAAAIGGLVAIGLAAAAPALLLGAWPVEAVGVLITGWLGLVVWVLRTHAGLNGLIRRWRAEEEGVREQLAHLGGQAHALETRLKDVGSRGA